MMWRAQFFLILFTCMSITLIRNMMTFSLYNEASTDVQRFKARKGSVLSPGHQIRLMLLHLSLFGFCKGVQGPEKSLSWTELLQDKEELRRIHVEISSPKHCL